MAKYFFVGPVHYLQNLQIRNSLKFSLKLSPTALFTHLKIILLQYFQFLTISDIQADPKYIQLEILISSLNFWD